ncbi:putative acyl esterase [Amycolatopsis jiangsuensis]|uniref:Putative acyl esterase n=1 Tax=Amycolatopsis jiangsuensis TaxID=1181879 RepID=A0A840IKN5_9PSEU|nr:CocE/NonD family hydrolase [Amycolatopsis jiangsuensis]MBB4682891.1 putative acyl esterase [Amycolatopsis jiangsuensis]
MFAGRGYQVVQSCRGTSGSGGQLRALVMETKAADALDIAGWVRGHAWFDG